MLTNLALALSLAALAAAGGLFALSRRARHARAELARTQHDAALALDRRCDVLQHQLDAMAQRRRIDHLLQLVGVSERQGHLEGDVARRLEQYVLNLHDEARHGAAAE